MRPLLEMIHPLETNSFNAFLQRKKSFDVPLHYHSDYEMTFIVSSTGLRYVGNSFEHFRENDLVLLGPNLMHCWKNNAAIRTQAAAVVIHWKQDLLGKDWLNCKEFIPIRKMLELANQGLKFDREVALPLRDRFLAIPGLPPFEKLMTLLDLLNTLAKTKKCSLLCGKGFVSPVHPQTRDRINKVFAFVNDHYSQKITLKEAARQANMSEGAFSRFFSASMRKTFFQFVNECRVNVSCKLLIETNKTIAAIGYECGYASLPFFYRQFKKFKKCSPRQFRSAYAGLEQF